MCVFGREVVLGCLEGGRQGTPGQRIQLTPAIVLAVVVARVVINAPGAHGRPVPDVEAVVGADALLLQEVLHVLGDRLVVYGAAEAEVHNGLAERRALGRHIVRVELEVREDQGGDEGRE